MHLQMSSFWTLGNKKLHSRDGAFLFPTCPCGAVLASISSDAILVSFGVYLRTAAKAAAAILTMLGCSVPSFGS